MACPDGQSVGLNYVRTAQGTWRPLAEAGLHTPPPPPPPQAPGRGALQNIPATLAASARARRRPDDSNGGTYDGGVGLDVYNRSLLTTSMVAARGRECGGFTTLGLICRTFEFGVVCRVAERRLYCLDLVCAMFQAVFTPAQIAGGSIRCVVH